MRWWGPLCTIFYSARALKQSAHWHVALLGHIILIPSQPVFALTPYSCVLSGKAIHANTIVFDLTRSGLEPTIYLTRGKYANHYTTDGGINLKQTYIFSMNDFHSWNKTCFDSFLLNSNKSINAFKYEK
jgi:hypothetical protein